MIVYPFFFAANYFILKNVDFFSIFYLSLLLMAIFGIIFSGLSLLTKDKAWSAFLAVLWMGWALYYGTVAQILQNILTIRFNLSHHLIFLVIYTLACVLMGSKWVWKKFETGMITNFLNIVTALIFIVGAYRLIRAETHDYLEPVDLAITNSNPQISAQFSQPDIYYIILDGYGRADVLEDIYQFDNSEFINFLTNRGFYIATQSQSNYMHTALSITSSLNFSYIQPLPDSKIRTPIIKRLISENRTRSVLENKGYQFVSFYNALYYTTIPDADIFLSQTKDESNRTFLEAQLIPGSIATIPLTAGLISPANETYLDQQSRIVFTFEQIGKLASSAGPKFVFAHILAPHAPYVFDQNGPLTPEKPYYLQSFGSSQESIQAYLGQLAYINSLVEMTIETILQNSASAPIMIIQGDHGPGVYFAGKKEESCLREKGSILNAYYFPDQAYDRLYKDITPVNSFRTILSQFFGMDVETLTDRTYFSSSDAAFSFEDITEEVKLPCQIP